jgi:hypothetical protein
MDLPMISKRCCDAAASTGGGTTIREISNSIALRADGQINSAKGPQSDPFSSWCRISKLAIVFVPDHSDPRYSFTSHRL